MLNKVLLCCVSLLMVISIEATAQGAQQELPPNWPWRGITMDSFGGNNDVADITRLADARVNAVELVLSVRNTARFEHLSPEAAWEKNLAWADQMLDACKLHGIVAIITFVQVPINPVLGIRQDSPEFWDDASERLEAVHLAGKLAQHFKNRGKELGAYEILNEPLVRRWYRQERPSAWPELRDAIILEIRKFDPDRYIVVTPGPGGEPSGYKDFSPLAKTRIIYGAHMYIPHAFTHQGIGGRERGLSYPGKWHKSDLEKALEPLIIFKKKYHVLVLIGEFSAIRWAPGAEQYIADCIDIFDQNGFGWMYFSYNGYHGWNPFYDDQYSTDTQSDWLHHYVGEGTKRWTLLRKAYEKNNHQ